MHKFLSIVSALLVALTFMPAQAATYVGNRTVNGAFGEVNLSVTTDGTQGALSEFNITDFEILFANNITFEFVTLRHGDSIVALNGTGLTATATELIFDFDSFSQLVFANGTAFYGMSGAGFGNSIAQCGFVPQCELLFFGSGIPFSTVAQFNSGPVVLATAIPCVGRNCVPPGGVPEPASWAMMIAGFGLVGAGLRRRRSKALFRLA